MKSLSNQLGSNRFLDYIYFDVADILRRVAKPDEIDRILDHRVVSGLGILIEEDLEEIIYE